MEAYKDGDEYKVEAVDDCPPSSHSDFFALPRFYTLRKVNSGTIFRLKLPRRLGWKAGEIVRLAPLTVLESAI